MGAVLWWRLPRLLGRHSLDSLSGSPELCCRWARHRGVDKYEMNQTTSKRPSALGLLAAGWATVRCVSLLALDGVVFRGQAAWERPGDGTPLLSFVLLFVVPLCIVVSIGIVSDLRSAMRSGATSRVLRIGLAVAGLAVVAIAGARVSHALR